MIERPPVYDLRRFILRTLSPVHVGSGDLFKRDVEIQFSPDRQRIFVLDMEAVFDRLSAHVEARSLRTISDMLARLRGNNVGLEEVSFHVLVRRDFPSNDLRRAIRDGAGRPLVPGSSLKGSLRTAIVRAFVQGRAGERPSQATRVLERLNRDPKRAAQNLEEQLLRPAGKKRPNEDLLRSLMVRDATFPCDKLGIQFVRVHSPSEGDPKRLANYTMAVEALEPEAEAEVEIALDSFLLGRPELDFPKLGLNWTTLAEWTQRRTTSLLQDEIRHFEALGWAGVIARLREIERAIATAGPGSIPLRVGWAIGWCGTTGALLEPQDRTILIAKYEEMNRRIGKYGARHYSGDRIFPKSRRLADANPSDGRGEPFGWMLLQPAGDRRLPIPAPFHPAAVSAAAAQPKGAPKPETPRSEKWTGCLLEWNPGSGGILRAKCINITAEARGQDALKIINEMPERSQERLKKKKEIKNATVVVQKLGNAWNITRVSITS